MDSKLPSTSPIFIVSSGRSGTQMMQKLVSEISDYEVHHEYLCNIIQPAAISYYLGIADREYLDRVLRETYIPAVYYSPAKTWIDSSNKLSWIIEPLFETFPDAKFVHLIRDGRRVCSSYLNKLGDECYADVDYEIFIEYLQGKCSIRPPPEKKYWWPPINIGGSFEIFSNLSQFEKIAHHWVKINEQIEKGLEIVPVEMKLTVKLEDIVSSQSTFEEFLMFLDLDYSVSSFSKVKRPHNVNVPVSHPLSPPEMEAFWGIAGRLMDKYGYSDQPDYLVRYK